MKDMPLISIIVPVYQVEAYLDKCISSIAGQTYTNLEIILVDDGSPDRCPAICDAWAAKDGRIQVIHKENGGLSDARNAGMAAAAGALMGFVDSDDWISPDMVQHLYDLMVQDDSDIAACGVEMVWEDGTPSRIMTPEGCYVLDAQDAMEAIIEESRLKQPVWYKLYRTELIRDIPFPVGKYHEDVFWSYQAVGRARRVSVSDRLCYFYLQRSGSIMGEGYSLKRLDPLEAKVARVQYIRQNMPALSGLAKRNLWFYCIYSKQMLLKYGTPAEKEKGTALIEDALRQYPIRPGCAGKTNLKQLVWLMMAKVSLRMVCGIRNKLGIGY